MKMKKKLLTGLATVFFMLGVVGISDAAILTFDDLITGATTYGFDGDGDFINDVIFSTSDPAGFNTVGPGPNMTYIQQPGLEGSSMVTSTHPPFPQEDLRVDFLNGAVNYLRFGFALNSVTEDDTATFRVYDSSNMLLASSSVVGLYTTTCPGCMSSFPEGGIHVDFLGVASYATFDFTSDYGRYIIDNFGGTFGSTENITPASVPEPSTLLLLGSGIGGLFVFRRKGIFRL